MQQIDLHACHPFVPEAFFCACTPLWGRCARLCRTPWSRKGPSLAECRSALGDRRRSCDDLRRSWDDPDCSCNDRRNSYDGPRSSRDGRRRSLCRCWSSRQSGRKNAAGRRRRPGRTREAGGWRAAGLFGLPSQPTEVATHPKLKELGNQPHPKGGPPLAPSPEWTDKAGGIAQAAEEYQVDLAGSRWEVRNEQNMYCGVHCPCHGFWSDDVRWRDPYAAAENDHD